jgi:hypothetical protein
MRGLVAALNEQGYGSSSASLRKMSRRILDLLSEAERALRSGVRHSEAAIAITDLGDALLKLQGEWEFSGMGSLPKVAGSLVSEFPDVRREFAFLVRLRSTLLEVTKLKRKGIPTASAEKLAAEEVSAALKILRPSVLRALKVVEEDEIHEGKEPASVAPFLRGLTTKTGGRVEEVRWDAEWGNWRIAYEWRKRLDHFWEKGQDGGDWDEDGWRADYVNPITKEVQGAIDAKFGRGKFEVSVGEKGHVDVTPL